MTLDIVARLGLSRRDTSFGDTPLGPEDVKAESEWAASYHVLAMGRQFQAYVVNWNPPSLNTQVRGFPFPPSHPYGMAASKIRAGGVTGNIGEAVAALLARRIFQLRTRDIAHIRPNQPFRRRKAPDYLLRLGPTPTSLARVWPTKPSTSGPDWWPTEAKARSTHGAARGAAKEGLKQLYAYWHTIHQSRPAEVGFGIVTCYVFGASLARIHVFVPASQSTLLTAMDAADYQDFVAGCLTNTVLRGAIHGC